MLNKDTKSSFRTYYRRICFLNQFNRMQFMPCVTPETAYNKRAPNYRGPLITHTFPNILSVFVVMMIVAIAMIYKTPRSYRHKSSYYKRKSYEFLFHDIILFISVS